MTPIYIYRTVTLDNPVVAETLPGNLYQGENSAHCFVISAKQDGQMVNLSGTVTGRCLRSDGTTILLSGTVFGGRAMVTLPQDCYNVNGRVQITIFVTGDGATVAVYSANGTVRRSQTEDMIDSGNAVPDIDDVIAMYEDVQTATDAAFAAADGFYATKTNKLMFDYITSGTYTSVGTTYLPIDGAFTLLNSLPKVGDDLVHINFKTYDRHMEELDDETIWGAELITRTDADAKWVKFVATLGGGSVTITSTILASLNAACKFYDRLLVADSVDDHAIQDDFVVGVAVSNEPADIHAMTDAVRFATKTLYPISAVNYITALLYEKYTYYLKFYGADLDHVRDGDWHVYNSQMSGEPTTGAAYFRIVAKIKDGQTISKETALSDLNSGALVINPAMDYGTITDSSQGEVIPGIFIRMVTTDFLHVENGSFIPLNQNYDYGIAVYDSAKNWLYNTPFYGFTTAYEMLKSVRYRDKYIKVVIALASDHSATIDQSDVLAFGKLFEISEEAPELEAALDNRYDYPPYYDAEVKATLNSIGDATSPDAVVFAMITDLHNNGDDTAEYLRSQIEVLRKIRDSCRLDLVILGGDLSDGTFADRATALDRMTGLVNRFARIGAPVLALRGNHDDNSYQGNKGVDYIVNKHDYYARVIAPLAENVMAPSQSYYYHDFDYADTRVIALDYLDYPETISNGQYVNVGNGAAWRGYSDDQVAWLCETLLSNTKGKVVVTSHYSTHPNLMAETSLGVLDRNADKIKAAMIAFNARNTFTFNGVSYNFANATGKILVQVTGHSHAFGAFKDSGIIWSTTGSPSPEVTQRFYDDNTYETMVSRPYFSAAEAHFNVFVVKEDSVKIISFGAMGDLTFTL